MKMNQWEHPSWDRALIAPPECTREEIADGYLEDGSDPDALVVESVEMTQVEVDSLPEFEA